jgi:tetratricopeptide (TPR) repeat protein
MPALRILLALLVLLALPVRAWSQEDIPEVARSLMEEGDRARGAGRLDDALAKYRKAIDAAPQLSSAYANAGAILFQQQKVEEAYRMFARGVEQAPLDRTLLSNAAAAAQQLGKSAEALTFVDRALEKNPRDAALHALRGTILRSLNRDADAITALLEATRLAPNEARHHFSLGNALYATGKKDDAIEEYRKAIVIDPDYTRAYYNLGAALYDVGRDSEALGAYVKALQPIDKAFAKNENVDPIHARAYANLGAIWMKQQAWQQAGDAYAKSLKLDPQSADAHYNLGFIYFNSNRSDRAEEEYRKALALDPTLPLAYLHLGQIAWKRGDAAGAVKLLRDGLARFDAPSKTLALRILGRAELKLGNAEAAANTLRANESDAESMILLARIERRAQRLDAASAALAKVPADNRAATLERALIGRDRGDLAAERGALEQLIAKDPNRAELRTALAVNLLRNGELDAARKYFDNPLLAALAKRDAGALAQMTNDPFARGDAGLLLWQAGRARDARAHLAAALAADPAWDEVALVSGEIALADREYSNAVELLARFSKCPLPPGEGGAQRRVRGEQVTLSLGTTDDLCPRAKRDLAIALLAVANSDPRGARPLLERATALDERFTPIANFIRGSIDLANGNDDDARTALNRAIAAGLSSAAESAAKKYLESMQPVAEAPQPSSSTPRRTVVVFLPDIPADTEKRLAETMSAYVAQLASASGVPLHIELFRRADDARSYFAANRSSIGAVIANPEFVSDLAGDLSPRFQFLREGRTSYRRVVIVPAASGAKDIRGRTMSIAEGLRDNSGAGAKLVLATDDDAAVANVLFGKSDAAFVSEANPLLARNTSKLRVIASAGASMPVIAFAPLLPADREAVSPAIRPAARTLTPLQVSGISEIETDRPAPRRIEVTPLPATSLGLVAPSDPPAKLALRANVALPHVTLNEEMYDAP